MDFRNFSWILKVINSNILIKIKLLIAILSTYFYILNPKSPIFSTD